MRLMFVSHVVKQNETAVVRTVVQCSVKKERIVFSPDVGNELRVKTKNIRLSRDWCLDTDEWKYRVDWVYLKFLRS
uniref:Agenet-like domain-containing protein n=1 Tax=Tanacetum cinerariifolium TaxID=118510 RepID=A0A699UQ03_TANCI|nr:agenet-like domain-containing protein [Tanacetum cinerariifolium]